MLTVDSALMVVVTQRRPDLHIRFMSVLLFVLIAATHQQQMPGSRFDSVSWIDSADNLWLFGGLGNAESSSGPMNDLWRYEISIDRWTWIGGSRQANQSGLYGNKSVANSVNMPGARSAAVTWFVGGNVWLFGGLGIDSNNTAGHLNDLWMYNMSSNEWTWKGGSNLTDQIGVYGDQGIPSDANTPGCRRQSIAWIDSSQDSLWLFGGVFEVNSTNWKAYNDLWQYTISTNEWTWIGGSDFADQPGVYGAKGVASNSTIPGARYSSVAWVDLLDTLWLFGGASYANQLYAVYNDLWKYTISTNKWTWIGGSSAPGASGNYGTQRVPSSSNMPGSRAFSTSSLGFSNSLWLYGAPQQGDFWHYNVTSNQWTWMTGSSANNQFANYGGKGMFLNSNTPGARHSSTLVLDSKGSLWLFGGAYYTEGASQSFNDLWCYNISVNQWAWISGSISTNQFGIYGLSTSPQVETPVVIPSTAVEAPTRSPSIIGWPTSSPVQSPSNETNITVIVPAIVIPVVVVAITIILVVVFVLKKAKRQKINNPVMMLSTTDKRLISYKAVTLQHEIGAGSYGKVFIGKWRSTKVAVKVGNSALSTEEFLKEAELQLNIPPHPNIIQLLGVSTDGPRPLVVLEYCNEGSLDRLLYDLDDELPVQKQITIAKAVAEGLNHLHENNIVHRDLAARNILMNNGEAKISDFGLSRALKQEAAIGKTSSNIGPVRWMAPESVSNQTYSAKSDVWMYGIILYEIVARQEPHLGEDTLDIAIKIRDFGITPSIPVGCTPVLKELMEKCWQQDPQQRPSMAEVCQRLDEVIV